MTRSGGPQRPLMATAILGLVAWQAAFIGTPPAGSGRGHWTTRARSASRVPAAAAGDGKEPVAKQRRVVLKDASNDRLYDVWLEQDAIGFDLRRAATPDFNDRERMLVTLRKADGAELNLEEPVPDDVGDTGKSAVKVEVLRPRSDAGVLEVGNPSEFLWGLLFNTTPETPADLWPFDGARYSASPSSLLDLRRGPFNGVLGNRTSKAVFVDRDPVVRRISDNILDRSEELKGQNSGSDKTHSPALLVAQAPGAGKSHLLAKLGEELPELYDSEGNKKMPIVSAFTFNSAMQDELPPKRLSGITEEEIKLEIKLDLGLRILYGAAAHMTAECTSPRCCDWSTFLRAFDERSSEPMKAKLAGDYRFIMEILRVWYGSRPVVILADEVGKSPREAVVRHELCRTMDLEAGQAVVVMSALSDYQKVTKMFKESNRRVKIFILPPLRRGALGLFRMKMEELNVQQFDKKKLKYKMDLAWGCTGGYARAVERMTKSIATAGQGLDKDVIRMALQELAGMGESLPPAFSSEKLERVLEAWDDRDCPFDNLEDTVNRDTEATYEGSVLVETASSGNYTKYFLTVAPWHAAKFLQKRQPGWDECPRCGKLMAVVGKAYRDKFTAIDQDDKNSITQASAYLTETTAVLGIMFAMVRQSAKLPLSLLQVESQSILEIGFDDTFSQDSDLATTRNDSTETVQNQLIAFLQSAVRCGQNKCNESMPFLIIAAPPACKAVDFVILGPGLQDLTAVQVKSSRADGNREENDLCWRLDKAWKGTKNATKHANISATVNFLAVVGSDLSVEASDYLVGQGIHVLQRKDLVEHIPPFLRHLSGLAAGAD